MFKNTLAISLLLLLLVSCRKEETILDDPITVTDPPTEVDGAFFSGQVTNYNDELVQTEIKVYQEGELIGEIQTDENGFYSTAELLIKQGPEVTFAIEEEGFANKYIRTSSTQSINQDRRVKLADSEANPLGEDQVLENPGDEDLVKVFGTFSSSDGTPITKAHAILIYNVVEEIPNEKWSFEGSYDLTDENGYIEFLAPQNVELYFFGVPSEESGVDCFEYLNENENNSLISLLSFDELGVLNEDYELTQREGSEFFSTEYSYFGELLDCDGNPVTDGFVNLALTYEKDGVNRSKSLSTTELDANGGYQFDFELCHSGNVNISITGETSEGLTGDVNFSTTASSIHLAPIQACNETTSNVLFSYLNLNIGNEFQFDSIEFSSGPIDPPYTFFGIGQHDDIGLVFLTIADMQVGEQKIDNLTLDWLEADKDPFAFSANNGELTATITKIENGEIIGTLEGDVETESLGLKTVTGDFILKYK